MDITQHKKYTELDASKNFRNPPRYHAEGIGFFLISCFSVLFTYSQKLDSATSIPLSMAIFKAQCCADIRSSSVCSCLIQTEAVVKTRSSDMKSQYWTEIQKTLV